MFTTRCKSGLLIVALLAICSAGLEAQEGFSVALDVSCDDTELRTLARSFFSRELRELGDVRVSTSGTTDFAVEAIALKEKRNWVMSVVISDLSSEGSAEGPGGGVVHHSLERGDSPEDLGRHIGLIVRDLDSDVLKSRR